MDELLKLARTYCQKRNLIAEIYIQGMTSGQALDDATIATLIRYHREWLR
jgi:hypothetical protein